MVFDGLGAFRWCPVQCFYIHLLLSRPGWYTFREKIFASEVRVERDTLSKAHFRSLLQSFYCGKATVNCKWYAAVLNQNYHNHPNNLKLPFELPCKYKDFFDLSLRSNHTTKNVAPKYFVIREDITLLHRIAVCSSVGFNIHLASAFYVFCFCVLCFSSSLFMLIPEYFCNVSWCCSTVGHVAVVSTVFELALN